MSFDDVWKDPNNIPSLAIPNHAVNRYRQQTGVEDRTMTDDDIRDQFKKTTKEKWHARVALSRNWGHEGFAIKTYYRSNRVLWLIYNPDEKTNHDFVLITVYNNDQFNSRMNGEFFSDSELNGVTPDKVPIRAEPSVQVPMVFKVECAERETKEFSSESAVLEYLQKLTDEDFTPKDWVVWKMVKTNITIGD